MSDHKFPITVGDSTFWVRLIDNGDGTVAPAIRQMPIQAEFHSIPAGGSLTLKAATGRVYALRSDRNLELLDAMGTCWELLPAVGGVDSQVFARPVLCDGAVKLKNKDTMNAARVYVQYE